MSAATPPPGAIGGDGTPLPPTPPVPSDPPVRGAVPFLAVWLPSLLAVTGTGLSVFVLGWWIGSAPQGGARLGAVVATASVVSLLLVTLLAGVVDTADRRRTLVTVLTLLLVPLAVLVAVLERPPSTATLLVAGACYVLVHSLQQLYMAAVENIGADLAPSHWPETRTALLTQVHTQLSRAVAPLLAGGLLAAGILWGVTLAAFGFVAVTLLAVHRFRRHVDALSARTASGAAPSTDPTRPGTVRPRPPRGAGHGGGPLRGTARDLATSVRLLRGHRELSFLILFGALGNLVVFPFHAVLPAFNAEYGLPTPAEATLYSASSSAYGAGMLAGTVVLVRLGRFHDTLRGLRAAAGAFALICLVLLTASVAPWPPTVVVAMALTGALFAVLVAVGGAVWLRLTPAAIRVRVFSLRRLTVFSTIPLGSLLMGLGGAEFGYRVFTRALVLAVLAALAVLWWVYLRRDGHGGSGAA
ncbi:MFS transporter [Allostreptomyces psammosilenae]|uniref:MFS family permease n=1 Tax=Allostreptomyces psammosilenae TaxID=1892865 RepID=A0A853A240_9ACTN|nr:MFS transporter [Allostreptomyces psammosilenae]NYI06954.1 MFS family permease [Allostreptomyces psammosilenae]